MYQCFLSPSLSTFCKNNMCEFDDIGEIICGYMQEEFKKS